MSIAKSRLSRGVALCAITLLTGCGMLPSSGPTKNQIYAGSVLREGDAFVISVTDRVNQIASSRRALGFSDGFRNAAMLGADTLRPGDTLRLTIWENVEDGLFASQGQSETRLTDVEVDEAGMIFVPYAGRIRAAGNTPDAVRRIITRKLAEQTPEPQVQVSREPGEGASVTVLGMGSGQSVVPIERNARSLSQMIATAGGITGNAAGTRITVTRGTHSESIFFDDLMRDPSQDIALRDGDRIIVEADQRSFAVLGATGGQTELKFARDNIAALEALAQVGGLSPTRADPTGVFVLRNEPAEITQAITGVEVTGTQRVIYVLDLTAPNGMFMARDFAMRDKDTIYVTEAPIVQFSNVIASLTGSLNGINGLANTVGGATGQRRR